MGGVDALFNRGTLGGLAVNDPVAGSGAEFNVLKCQSLEPRLGCGCVAFGDRLTFTPVLEIGVTDTCHELALGWRAKRDIRGNTRSLELSFEGRRR